MSQRNVPDSTNPTNGPESDADEIPTPDKPGDPLRIGVAIVVGVISALAAWYFSTHPGTWTTEAEKFFVVVFVLFAATALGYLAWRLRGRFQWRRRYA